MNSPVLVACAHGTRNPTGRRLIAELALAARSLRPGLETTAAFVDVQPPTVVDVVAGLSAAGRPAVVVPLLLSGGYHVHVDIAGAVAGAAGTVAARPRRPRGERQLGDQPAAGGVARAVGAGDEHGRTHNERSRPPSTGIIVPVR